MTLTAKNISHLFFGIIIVFVLGILLVGCGQVPLENNNSNIQPEISGQVSPLDGEAVGSASVDLKPIATVMDNFFASRPLSGINSASVVYELPVEAKISRFLAIFRDDKLPNKIGPIRSARPYLAELADEYRAIFVHAGGSPQVLSELENNVYQVDNLDGLTTDQKYFWRNQSRKAPYNLYISSEAISNFKQDKNISDKIDLFPWFFQAPANLTDQKQVVTISNYFEPIVWRYDAKSIRYLRYLIINQQEEPCLDEEGQQIAARNLILQMTAVKSIDSLDRKEVDLSSGGEAIIYQGGQKIEGTWQKKNDRTRFYDSSGQEIEMFRGNSWIEIIPAVSETL